MKGLAPMDSRSVALSGSNLVEAAAGTGKTWTIATLYLRLVLEKDLDVGNILVVTYTHAATRELRQRIRSRLVDALEAYRRGETGEDPLGTGQPDAGQALKRLQRAVVDFDEAAIFTIHGFCRRALAESAFESALPFESELLTDEREFLGQVVDDFWRREMYPASILWVDWLHNEGVSEPEVLLDVLHNLIGKPYLRVAPLPAPRADGPVEKKFMKEFETLRRLWHTDRPLVEKLLLEDKSLKRTRYRPASILVWLRQMDQLLAGVRPGFGLLRKFKRLDRFQATVLADSGSLKKGGTPPSNPFFDACDAFVASLEELVSVYEQRYAVFRHRLLGFVMTELPARKAARQVQSFDDLLTQLSGALDGPSGQVLAEKIRSDYPAVLIDEFQDTDPVQYRIFWKIYQCSGQPMFMVGDPKQAIYSFRGADVFTYLGARQDAECGYTLDQNWRSTPALVSAINLLFEHRAGTGAFLLEEIAFQKARPAPLDRPCLTENAEEGPALVMWTLGREESGKPIPKYRAGEQCAAATAGEIGRLLALPAQIDGAPVEPGDIAVLVRTHAEATTIEEALLGAGIPSVRQSQYSVYQTHEAEELERLLIAVIQPARESLVRAALLTDLMGGDGNRLHELAAAEGDWEECMVRFHRYQGLWRDHGFMRMFRELAASEDLYPRLLRFNDGERRLTNLLQLAELIHAQGQRRGGMGVQLKWFSAVRHDPPVGDEPSLMRLESDDDRVRIVTVHSSKGLEYPVVFLPFAWSGGLRVTQREQFVFHDSEAGNQATVEFGSEDFEQNLASACREELAENLRLLYVALTRACSRCYLAWGAVNEAATSPLAWLLHRPEISSGQDPLAALATHFRSLSDADIDQDLARLVRRSRGCVLVRQVPDDEAPVPLPVAGPPPALAARELKRTPQQAWRLTSFSGLATGHDSESPDHDSWLVSEAEGDSGEGIFAFPRGARAGTCLHQVFEELDFRESDVGVRESVIERALKAHGFSHRWVASVADMVARVLDTPLDPEGRLRLADISREQRVDEMAFYYPMAGLHGRSLGGLVERHGFGDSQLIADSIRRLRFQAGAGFMHGFIDLVFESEGRYYLADYKSNFLAATPEGYRPAQLNEVMAREQYSLQYLIYTVAVHRFLRMRLPDYDYERHFGGVYYLFLRGMDPALGHRCGVFYDRPGRALVEALDCHLQGRG